MNDLVLRLFFTRNRKPLIYFRINGFKFKYLLDSYPEGKTLFSQNELFYISIEVKSAIQRSILNCNIKEVLFDIHPTQTISLSEYKKILAYTGVN